VDPRRRRGARCPTRRAGAAAAALAAGDAAGALALLDRAGRGRRGDRRRTGRLLRAPRLSRRPRREAERLAASIAPSLDADDRRRLADAVAQGWIARCRSARARAPAARRAAAQRAGRRVALYAATCRRARAACAARRGRRDGKRDAALTPALAAARAHARGSARRGGAAFLRAGARRHGRRGGRLRQAAQALPEAAPLLRVTAARLHLARREDAAAVALWQRVVEESPTAAEAPEAALAWARALRRRGDAAGARERLEHLIVTWPESALVPIARRELEASS
jgi:hypothetical protein